MKKDPCILAVDDEPSVLRVLQRALEPAGFKVLLASNGDAALELIREQKPDLMLLDIMMPGLDGFQVLNRIRTQYGLPVIMLTARHEVAVLHDSFVLGADDFVTKPFSILELTARIRAKLRRCGQDTITNHGDAS